MNFKISPGIKLQQSPQSTNQELNSAQPSGNLQNGKRTAQLSAHPQQPYLRAQVIMQAGMSCNGLQWLETAADCHKVREDATRLFISTWARMRFFRHFTVKKTSLPLPAERVSCLYIQWVAYK